LSGIIFCCFFDPFFITSGPEHPWLVAAYADSVPHPFGSVIGQEFFEMGLIPSDTDFRIFRDFGKIPGMLFQSCYVI
jgi:hypothetical protein